MKHASPRARSKAELHYVHEDDAGIVRTGSAKRFQYKDHRGAPIRDAEVLARIRSLAIPPAWTNVWICPRPDGHIQATGRDARGRKQYRYHPLWRARRDADKYARMLEFGAALRRIRATTGKHLALRGLPREKVLATVVRLLELTHARIGNDEYARENKTFGLTTLENRHVVVSGADVRFRFRGKSGKTHLFDVHDPELARVVRRCEELPGQRLFEYVDDEGQVRAIGSHDVNAYIRSVAGDDFSAKDFRTLAGTVLAARALRDQPASATKVQRKRAVREALGYVAGCLGNTVAVCKKSYVHPAVLAAYERAGLGQGSSLLLEEEASVFRIVRTAALRLDALRVRTAA